MGTWLYIEGGAIDGRLNTWDQKRADVYTNRTNTFERIR